MDLTVVGRRISAIRKSKGITQEELADMAGISPAHVGVIERGVKIPTLGTFVAIANALSVPADTLLLDIVERSYESASTELSRMIAKQPLEMQRKIYRAVSALVEE